MSNAEVPGRIRPLEGADWPVADPRDFGYDTAFLDETIDHVGRETGVYSVLLIRGGKLIAERYFREGTRSKNHNLKSASKSIISALIGLLIEDRRLALDDAVVERLQVRGLEPGRENITVRDLLMMASGLESTSHEAYNVWITSSDWVKGALARPVFAEPGKHYRYSTGNTHLLSALVSDASGRSTRSFATERLFEPLGIEIGGWETDPKGIHIGGNNLAMIPRDMAKFGELYLRGGNWRGRQVVPAEWVNVSTQPHIATDQEIYGDYGYHWYTPSGSFRGDFIAVGFGGQYIYVSPQFDAVVVVTATLTSKGRTWERRVLDMIQQKLLPGSGVTVTARRPDHTSSPDPGGSVERNGGPGKHGQFIPSGRETARSRF